MVRKHLQGVVITQHCLLKNKKATRILSKGPRKGAAGLQARERNKFLQRPKDVKSCS